MKNDTTKLKTIQAKIDEVTKSVATLSELHNTLIDQVTELNLLLATEKKSVYEQLLFRFDADIAKEIAEDALNELNKKETK